MADDGTARARYARTYAQPDAAPRGADTDPLSELARLIGQSDLFGAQAKEAPRGTGFYRAADVDPAWQDQPADDGYAQAGPAQDGYAYEPAPAEQDAGQYGQYSDAAQPHHDQYYQYDAPQVAEPYYEGQYDENGQLLPQEVFYADDAPAEEGYAPAPRRRSGLVTVLAVVALALIGTAGAYAYRTLFGAGAPAVPPLIKADAGPNKIVPAPSGDSAASKQIYDRVGANGQAERVVSREEKPVDVAPVNPAPAFGPPPAVSAPVAPPAMPGWAAPAAPAQVAAPQPPPASPTEPRKVHTVTIRPDQGMQPAGMAAPSAGLAPRAANEPLSLTPQAVGTRRVASAEPGLPVSRPSSAAAGAYMVQVLAQKTQEQAAADFRATQARFPSLLGSRPVVIRKKETSKGTFYGAQVGPFASRDDANQLCEQLKSAGGSCIVQRN